jgi:hypothetical protein
MRPKNEGTDFGGQWKVRFRSSCHTIHLKLRASQSPVSMLGLPQSGAWVRSDP